MALLGVVRLDAPLNAETCILVGMPNTLHNESIGDIACPLAHLDDNIASLG